MITWRKSSASKDMNCVEVGWHKAGASEAGNCVEVGWHKSSASSANGHCVEVGQGDCSMVHVRDTKNREGGELQFTPQAWTAFIAGIKAGTDDTPRGEAMSEHHND
jgi:hypothetical protein